MGDVVQFVALERPSRSEQRTIYRISLEMLLMLKVIEETEAHGGVRLFDLRKRTRSALESRGLIAIYHPRPNEGRACLSPIGRCAIRARYCNTSRSRSWNS